MKLSFKKTCTFVLILLVLVFSAMGVTPAMAVIDGTSFAIKVDFTTGTNPDRVAIGDLDGDGKLDLAVTNNLSNTISVFRNISTSGAIAYASKVDFTTGTTPLGVAIGDLDGDGKSDLAVTNNNNTSVSIFRNTSTSGIIDASSFAAKVDFTTGAFPWNVAIGDLDGDGKLDLAVTNDGSASVSVFRNTSTSGIVDTSSFAVKVDFTTGTAPLGIAIDDLDGDGKSDLAVTNSNNTVSLLRNISTSGTVSFATKEDFITGTLPFNVAIGDLDGDGKPDLAVTNRDSNNISVFRNISTSGTIAYAAKVDFTTGTNPLGIAIGDLDGDSKPDLAVANSGSAAVSVFRNTSTSGIIDISSFASKVDFTTGASPRGVVTGDFDVDGKPDLAMANLTAGTISLLRNTELTVLDVTSDTPNGMFKIGDTIDAKVKFFGNVNVVGVPQLTFETGAIDRTVNYVSGSGTNTLLFNYTVQAGDTSADLNYVDTASLALNGGTIKDASSTIDAVLTLPALAAPGSFGSYNNFVIDGILPVAYIDTKPADPSNSTSATFTFSATDNLTVTPNFVYWCNLDGGSYVLCGSSTTKIYTGLTNGLHTFNFTANDEAGNETVSVNYIWTVVVPPPPIFTDVPYSYWANSYIERLYTASITGGCVLSPLQYCPDSTVTRAQMAIFLLKGMHGSSYTPPAVNSNTGFSDVAADYWAAAWIKQLAAEGITSGCGAGIYCPDSTVTRAQMAIFLLKAKNGSNYAPPAVGGSTGFNDVAIDYWAAPFIKQLVTDGITSGCGTGIYCPDAEVTRAQMAVFLVKAFGLP